MIRKLYKIGILLVSPLVFLILFLCFIYFPFFHHPQKWGYILFFYPIFFLVAIVKLIFTSKANKKTRPHETTS